MVPNSKLGFTGLFHLRGRYGRFCAHSPPYWLEHRSSQRTEPWRNGRFWTATDWKTSSHWASNIFDVQTSLRHIGCNQHLKAQPQKLGVFRFFFSPVTLALPCLKAWRAWSRPLWSISPVKANSQQLTLSNIWNLNWFKSKLLRNKSSSESQDHAIAQWELQHERA